MRYFNKTVECIKMVESSEQMVFQFACENLTYVISLVTVENGFQYIPIPFPTRFLRKFEKLKQQEFRCLTHTS